MSRLLIILTLFISSFSFGQNELKKYLAFAEQKYNEGDYVYAIEYFQKAMELDSNSVTTIWKHAEALRAYKDYPKANYYYKKVIAKDEGFVYPNALLYAGMMQKQMGNYDEALETFKYVKKRFSKDKNAYIYLKSKREVESCAWAKSNLRDTLPYTSNLLPATVNTTQSEFGHFIENQQLYFSRFLIDSSNVKEEVFSNDYHVKLFKNQGDFNEKSELISSLNLSGFNSVNGTFSIDKSKFYFSACQTKNGITNCKICVAKYVNQQFSAIDTLGSIINSPNANTTNPCIAKIDNQEYLIFSSNRDNNVQQDLWMSLIKNGNQFSTPKAIKQLNSIENEITPWFDTISNTLYYASTWWDGFGGYDVYKSTLVNGQFQAPLNIGLPFNSPANDNYFFKYEDTLYLSSNRIGTTALNNPTCCSDIFEFKPKVSLKNTPKDSLNIVFQKETFDELNKRLPITLYFHNDIPNPKSLDSTTSINYINSYTEYRAMLDKYQKEYSTGLTGAKAEDAKEDIESFFIEYVDQGVKDLELFKTLLLEELRKGGQINVTVKGFASPLAKSDYNVNLTKRRIQSFVNYLKEYNNGEFIPYIEKTAPNGGFVTFSPVPFGEYRSNKFTSDNPNDEKNSIYSRAAALERKIEIQSIEKLAIPKQKDSIKLNTTEQLFDFNLVAKNSIVEHKFIIKNEGSKTIELNNIRIPCECNAVQISKKVLDPNETTEITIQFNATGYPEGKFVKSVYLGSTNTLGEYRLIVTGKIGN